MYEAIGAYRAWVKDNGPEKLLPGLEKYTAEQLFFISFGNVWCSLERSEYLRKIILSDVSTIFECTTGDHRFPLLNSYFFPSFLSDQEHAPGRYRVNGVVSNSVDFAKIFNCPAGSKMNPAKRCRVW